MSQLIFNEQSASPSTPSAGKVGQFYFNSNPPLLAQTDDTGLIYLPSGIMTSSVSNATGFASDTYLAGSGITLPLANLFKAQTQYQCMFDMTKTAAGTGAFTVNVRLGTLGTTGDTSRLSLAFAVGTAVADTGTFELFVNFRSVGASAIISGMIRCSHLLAITGLITTGASGIGIITGTGSAFDSTTPTRIGISVNGGSAFAGTNTIVQSRLINL
jgi:hypothetical protein